MPTTEPYAPPLSDPPALLAIARAARAIGDRDLERAARRLLRERYGIDLSFCDALDPERGTADGR